MKPGLQYRFHVRLISEDDGSFSAVVLNLPGVGSCGDTEEQAIENVKEAIRGALDAYADGGEPIPWKDTSSVEAPAGTRHLRITVNA